MMMASLFNSADLPKSQVANQTAVAEYIKFAAEKKLCKHRVLVHGRNRAERTTRYDVQSEIK